MKAAISVHVKTAEAYRRRDEDPNARMLTSDTEVANMAGAIEVTTAILGQLARADQAYRVVISLDAP